MDGKESKQDTLNTLEKADTHTEVTEDDTFFVASGDLSDSSESSGSVVASDSSEIDEVDTTATAPSTAPSTNPSTAPSTAAPVEAHRTRRDYIELKRALRDTQEQLRNSICLVNHVDISTLRTVAGVDLAYWKQDDKEYACCCIVVFDFKTSSVIERKSSVGEVTVPYIAGYLAFREYDLVEKTVRLLENEIDLYVFDGNGYLHPRHMGLATYAGIKLNKPSIGIAKTFYKFARVDYSDLPVEAFSYKDIVINDEVYGRVIRTHTGVKPIFLSIGTKVDLETATTITKMMIDKNSRVPKPTRYADLMTHKVRQD